MHASATEILNDIYLRYTNVLMLYSGNLSSNSRLNIRFIYIHEQFRCQGYLMSGSIRCLFDTRLILTVKGNW